MCLVLALIADFNRGNDTMFYVQIVDGWGSVRSGRDWDIDRRQP